MYDVLIRGATVCDGTGGPAFPADVAIRGGRIALLRERREEAAGEGAAGSRAPSGEAGPGAGDGAGGWPRAARVIDARGLHLAPGFIDIHNHSDLTLLADPRAESMIGQGVTTVVVGNCGLSVAPWPGPEAGEHARVMKEDSAFLAAGLPDFPWDWRSFGEYLARLEAARPAVNVVALVGHSALREQVMGRSPRAPTGEELGAMKRLLEEALADGAAGMSSGLIYYPSCYATTGELVELARVAGRRGKLYTTHIRGEGETLFDSIREAIQIARRAGVSTQISHLKAESRPMWGRLPAALALIDEARREGLPVDCDQYPYTAYNTTLGSFLPPEVMAGDWRKVLSSRAGRDEIRRVMEEGKPGWTSSIRGMEWSHFVVDGSGDPAVDGSPLAGIAAAQGKDPMEAFFDLLLAYGPQLRVIGHAMREDDVEAGVARPDVMVGSDGFALPYEGAGHPHPRSFGTFPRVLGLYSRERGLLPLEVAVAKMTSLPARKLGLRDRGLVREGYWADLVLFDAAVIRDRATFAQPRRRPVGVAYVFVNGRLALGPREGRGEGCSGERGGQVLR